MEAAQDGGSAHPSSQVGVTINYRSEGDLLARLTGYAATHENGVLGRVTAGRDRSPAAQCFSNTLVQRILSSYVEPVKTKLVVCSRTPRSVIGQLQQRLSFHLPGLRVLTYSATETKLVPLLRHLAEAGSEPLLERWRAMSGQEVTNNAGSVIHGLGRTTPTLLLLSDADAIPLGWLPSPPPDGLRIILFTCGYHDAIAQNATLELLRRGSSVVHFTPDSANSHDPSSCLRPWDGHLLGRQLEALSGNPLCRGLLGRIEREEGCGFQEGFAAVFNSVVGVDAAAAAGDPPDSRNLWVRDDGSAAAALGYAIALLARFPAALEIGDLERLVIALMARHDPQNERGVLGPLLDLLAPLLQGKKAADEEACVIGHNRLWVDHVRYQLQSRFALDIADMEVALSCLQAPPFADTIHLRVHIVLPLLTALGRSDAFATAVADWDTLRWLYKNCSAIEISRLFTATSGASELIGTLLARLDAMWRTTLARTEFEHRAFVVGQLVSQSGNFAVAREIITNARRPELTVGGLAELALALNEIREWDSRRNWADTSDLDLLHECSAKAVTCLRGGDSESRVYLSYALSALANYKFKLACLYSGGERTEVLNEADVLVEEAISVASSTTTHGVEVPSLALAVAKLVGGVVSIVRSQGLMDAGLSAIDEILTALDAFYAAGETIERGVASPSEISIFVHSNIAETYFFILDEHCLGLFHLVKSVEVSEQVFGKSHINTTVKLRDLAAALERLGLDDDAKQVRLLGHKACPIDDEITEPGPYRFVLKQRGYLRASWRMGFTAIPDAGIINEQSDMLAVD
eukprot:m.116952 g.116952  ORF g.116952 m.116952 type:complete len:807 (-) comp13166_c0_seq1:62-2482(-)